MALNPLVSLFGRLVARSGRKRDNRQTDRRTDGRTYRPSTVTLAAHARRGLTTGPIELTNESMYAWFVVFLWLKYMIECRGGGGGGRCYFYFTATSHNPCTMCKHKLARLEVKGHTHMYQSSCSYLGSRAV